MAEQIDWTKYLVPRVNSNADSHAFGMDPNSLDTTDLVSLPSVSEFEAQSLLTVKPTDFARAFMEKDTTGMGHACKYRQLRTPGHYDERLDPHYFKYDNRYVGIVPSISLKLPAQYTLAQLTEQLGLTKKTTQDGQDFYQVSLGEWPRTQVASELSNQLDDRFYGEVADDHFRCTGRLYTTPTSTAIHGRSQSSLRQNPEYKYRGEKYVRVIIEPENDIFPFSGRLESAWYKVEPITWWVKNSDAVASGQATQIDLECAEVIMGRIPFCPQYEEENDCSFLWQNSMTRAFLNGADSRQLDGNPAVVASHWDFTQGGFLQQALNMTREPTRVYTIPTFEKSLIEYAYDGCLGMEKLLFLPMFTACITMRSRVVRMHRL